MARYIIKFKDTGSRVGVLSAQSRLNRLENIADKTIRKKEFNEGIGILKKEFEQKKNRIKDKLNVRGNRCRIKHEYDMLPEMIAVDIDDEELLKELQSDPTIDIKKDKVGRGGDAMDWGYVRTKVNARYQGEYSGQGIKIGIVDSGIRPDHEDLPYPSGWKDYVNNMPSPYDDRGHGTFITGIIAAQDNGRGYIGVAPDADIYMCKVINANNFGYISDFIAGIDWARGQGVDIINFSLVSENYDDDLVSATRRAYNDGIIVVACTGNGTFTIIDETGNWDNTGRSTVDCPAVDYSCIGVGSIGQDDRRSGFSNYGDGIDVVAPGDYIISSYINGSSSYVSWSGTSFATAYVTGHLACLSEKFPDYSHYQLRDKLRNSAEKLNGYTFDGFWNSEVGYGLVVADGVDYVPTPGAPSSPYFDTSKGINGREENLQVIGAGLFHIKWNPPSDASSIDYYEFSYRQDDTTTWTTLDVSATNYSFYVRFGYSYEMRVRAHSNAGSGGFSSWSSVNVGTMNPKNPTLQVNSVNENSIKVTPSIVGSGAFQVIGRYSGVLIRVQEQNGEIAFERYSASGNNVSVTCTGLKSNTTYIITARSYLDVNGVRLWGLPGSIASTSVTTTGLSRPTNFAWSLSKTGGANFNLTASEWNSFTSRINQFRQYKSLSNYSFTTAYSGNNFTAKIFNQAINAINNMSPPTSPPSLKVGLSDVANNPSLADSVTAWDLNRIRDSLNSIP